MKCSKRCQIAEIGKTLESETRGNMFSSPSLQQLQKQRQSCFRLNVGNVSIIQVFRETKSQVPRTKCSGKLHLYDLIKYSIKISTNTSCVVWVHGKADFLPLCCSYTCCYFSCHSYTRCDIFVFLGKRLAPVKSTRLPTNRTDNAPPTSTNNTLVREWPTLGLHNWHQSNWKMKNQMDRKLMFLLQWPKKTLIAVLAKVVNFIIVVCACVYDCPNMPKCACVYASFPN